MDERKLSSDAAEISDLLDVVSIKLPHMLNALRDVLYSPDAGKQMGQAVGTFYKELVDAGIDQEEALKLTKEYMAALRSVTNMIDPT